MYYPKSVSFIELLMDFCTYDDILDTIWITDKKLLHCKLSKFLRVYKTDFPRPVTYVTGILASNLNKSVGYD